MVGDGKKGPPTTCVTKRLRCIGMILTYIGPKALTFNMLDMLPVRCEV